jgi:hypothetical protein
LIDDLNDGEAVRPAGLAFYALAQTCRPVAWKNAKKRAKTSTNKAGMSLRIKQIVLERGARAKPECPLESVKGLIAKGGSLKPRCLK